ncbi:hypothetical protein AQ916_07110 [Burkholderia pseudomallei]|uniref:hypothetical protein n=1 Tax=Burkholderia pseudomallei TaxID=28450 RepID=UPI000975D65A|nr:hypothetical protein [Burkholderia pseudomallei]ONC38513.1 hypothetical protein AQ916_07110 [Burkholderia pseudomallei]
MSDLNATQGADGATNASDGATADAAPSSSEPAFPTDAGGAPVGELGSAAPAGPADVGSTQSATIANAPTDGTTGAAAGADGAAAALEGDAITLLADAVNNAPPAVEAAAVAFVPLMVRVEQLGRRAFESGATDEHNLMAWLYQHVEALHRAIAGAPSLPLSDDAKALVDDLKGLL